jgi:hypothetical protein
MSAHKIYIREVKAGKQGLLYDAEYDGEVICASTLTPFLDACRVLQGRGLGGPAEMWDTVRPYPRMKSTVEAAAKLTVTDVGYGPVFRKWRPRHAQEGQDGDLEEAG